MIQYHKSADFRNCITAIIFSLDKPNCFENRYKKIKFFKQYSHFFLEQFLNYLKDWSVYVLKTIKHERTSKQDKTRIYIMSIKYLIKIRWTTSFGPIFNLGTTLAAINDPLYIYQFKQNLYGSRTSQIWILCINVQQYAQLNEANHPIKCELESVWL